MSKAPKRNIPDVGASAGHRSTTVEDVMTAPVTTAGPGDRVRDIRELMAEGGFHCVPVVDGDGEAVGIVTASDLVNHSDDTAKLSAVMTDSVYTVPSYSAVHVAARVMRNHHIHHLVVTMEKKVVGILSSFDLLRLVEDKRFVAKNPSSKGGKGGKRKKVEGV